MQITANEIDTVEEAGVLNNSPVKMIRTKGGFWIAFGRQKGQIKEEALAAGSHPGIVKYNLEKQYPDFQPALMKSEYFNAEALVEKHSHFLSEELRKSGHDIYSVQNGNNVEFHVQKLGKEVHVVEAEVQKEHLLIKSLNIGKEFSRAMAGATVEKAVSCNLGLKLKAK